MTCLIIRLQKAASAEQGICEWVFVNKNYKSILAQGKDWPEESDNIFKDLQEIVVIVPTIEIFLTEVTMPRLSPDRLKKAIPYALEDKLTEDASTLDFIIGEEEEEGVIPVTVVNKERIQAWQMLLNNQFPSLHTHINALVPDALVIPWKPHEFHILLDEEIAIVRTGKQAGFAIEKESLVQALPLLLNTQHPTALQLYCVAGSEDFTKELNKLAIPVHTNAISQPLILMAESIKKPYPFNLIENVYSHKQRRANMETALRICTVLTVIWLLVSTMTAIASYFMLGKEKKFLNVEMGERYHVLFPGSSLPSNAKAIVKKKFDELHVANIENTFLRLVSIVSPEITNLIKSGMAINKMNYKNNQIEFDVTYKNPNLLENVVKTFESQNLETVLSDTSLTTEGLIAAHLKINEVHGEH